MGTTRPLKTMQNESIMYIHYPKIIFLLIAMTHARVHQHQKKIYSVDFFSKASWAELTNYVIRHISKYGNIMSSFFVMLDAL